MKLKKYTEKNRVAKNKDKMLWNFLTSGYRQLTLKNLCQIHKNLSGTEMVGTKGQICSEILIYGVRHIEVDNTDPENILYNILDEAMNNLTTIKKYE